MVKSEALLSELDELLHKQQRLMNIAFANRSTAEATKTTTEEEVEARAIPKGSCVYLWKQDPSVTRVGIRKVFLPHIVNKGPRDNDIEVVMEITNSKGAVEKDHKATEPALPDSNNDFLKDIDGDPFAFDLVHTYTVARLTLDMYQRDLGVADWRWQWDQKTEPGTPKTPLRIIAHAGEKCNAVYHRGKKVLKFYYYTPQEGKTTYLCRSFDIVAHETGHAILDALKPKLYPIKNGQSGALHESFADLTAIFSVLNQLDLCEDVIAETKGDLRQAKYVTAIGEQFAGAMRASEGKVTHADDGDDDNEMEESAGMRDANNTLVGSEVGANDIYALANVFTGYVWDVLVSIFNWERDPKLGSSDAETLLRVSRTVRRLLLTALTIAGDVPDFTELSFAMERACETIREHGVKDIGDIAKYKEFIVSHRAKRELAAAGKPPQRRASVDLGSW